MNQQPLPQPTTDLLIHQTDEFKEVIGEQDPVGEEGIVKNIDELKELIVEGKNNLVDEHGVPLTTDVLKELVDPDSSLGTPQAIPS
ncbi:hypothetical protein GK091_24275 [Spirosoma agri]|uniref:Uncharacterized protein n=1 Tax=Spirosoma agri TaxID=1987381 RepID=A0A6M0INU3_9BACT|nr:hypothetical protein [Spirosoma agri]NEU70020.1 hypothetical protein [Spirosoma agri]